jgi:hypothetical protein
LASFSASTRSRGGAQLLDPVLERMMEAIHRYEDVQIGIVNTTIGMVNT